VLLDAINLKGCSLARDLIPLAPGFNSLCKVNYDQPYKLFRSKCLPDENIVSLSDALTHYLDTWNLSDPQLLAETVTSKVYTVTTDGTQVILKILNPLETEEQNGAIALRYFGGRGTVRLLCYDDGAHLLEYADGEDLSAMARNGHDDQATAIIADVLNEFHSVNGSWPDELPTLNRWFRYLFRKADEDRNSGLNTLYVRGANVAEKLLTEPVEVRVLHGDIHHENIRHRAQRGWLAFDPKGIIGERTYDVANTFCNPENALELVENEARILRTAEIFSHKLGITRDRILSFVFMYTCLSASWIFFDGGDPTGTLNIAALVEPHVSHG
jgi:streptomycin 6-kinase